MMKQKMHYLAQGILALCLACSLPALQSKAAILPETFTIGEQEKPLVDQTHFGFGSMEGPRTFVSPFGGYRIEIPKGYQADYGSRYYDKIYYTPEDAVLDEGAAVDFMLVSDVLSEEKPDPENIEDNAVVLMSVFINEKAADGTAFDVDAYAKKLILKSIERPELLNFLKISETQLAGAAYTHYEMDYTDALQAYYRTKYPEGGEHPVFDEHFDYKTDVYVRKIGDKYLVFYAIKSGEQYRNAPDLVTFLQANETERTV